MKKKTIIIVCVSSILAILAIAVIATFPSYLFEETNTPVSNPNTDSSTEPVQGDDAVDLGGEDNGIEGVLPGINDSDIGLPEPPQSNYNTLAEQDGAKLLAEDNAFPKNTEIEIDELGILSKTYYRARHYVRDFANEYSVFEITAEKDGKAVQPTGVVKLVLPIPDDYNLDNIEVYYLLSKGGVAKINGVIIDKDAKTATVNFTQTGVYILIEKDKKADSNTSSEDSTTSSNTSSDEQSTSSETPEDTSSNTDSSSNESSSSDITSSDTPSNPDETPDTPSEPEDDPTESTPSENPMNGWTPWY